MYKILLLFLIPLLASCQTAEKLSQYPKQVGDIEFDKNLDKQNFKVCNNDKTLQYYELDKGFQNTSVNFNLSWSHYLKLMRIKDPNERKFYEIESFKNNWSLRELQLSETLPENLKSIDEIEKELSKSTEI